MDQFKAGNGVTKNERFWRRNPHQISKKLLGHTTIIVALTTVTLISACVSKSPCPSTIRLEINPQESSIVTRPTSNNQPKVGATMTSGSFYCQKWSNEVASSKVDAVRIYITTNVDYTLESKAYLPLGSTFNARVELFTRNGTSISEKEFGLSLSSLAEGQNKTTMSTSVDIMAETAEDIDRISIGWVYR